MSSELILMLFKSKSGVALNFKSTHMCHNLKNSSAEHWFRAWNVCCALLFMSRRESSCHHIWDLKSSRISFLSRKKEEKSWLGLIYPPVLRLVINGWARLPACWKTVSRAPGMLRPKIFYWDVQCFLAPKEYMSFLSVHCKFGSDLGPKRKVQWENMEYN